MKNLKERTIYAASSASREVFAEIFDFWKFDPTSINRSYSTYLQNQYSKLKNTTIKVILRMSFELYQIENSRQDSWSSDSIIYGKNDFFRAV